MTSLSKLEEEIARTKDLVIRKQLQELLDKREERRDKTINDAKEIGAGLQREIEVAGSAFFTFSFVAFLIGVPIILIVLFLDWVGFITL